jgi:phosphatidylserine/phosphatidylglycerophosphate/cardiolipin synthase-like enzyme
MKFIRNSLLFIAFIINFSLLAEKKINVFFNKSVDNSVAEGDTAHANVRLDSLLCTYINNTEYSIDCCVYNFTEIKVRDALISAHNRGVEIRFITDNENMNLIIDSLINAGIPVIDDNFSILYNGYYNMHNKFFVFDYRDSSSLQDDIVWTGSCNISNWSFINNAENVITIHDNKISKAYTEEFEEMWGSNNNTPNSLNSKFSSYKIDNTNHQFTVDGINIEIYFSPSDNFIDNLISKISTSDYESYFCIFYFSHQDISNKLKEVWNEIGNSDSSNIRGVFDDDCWINNFSSEARDMAGISGSGNPWNPGLDTNSVILSDNLLSNGMLHHKYLLIDVEHPNSNPWIISGSANWSYWGDNYNDENIIFIQSDTISNLFFQEWKARYSEAGGEFSGVISNYIGNNTLELSSYIIIDKLIIYLYLNEYFNMPIKVDVINIYGQKVACIPLINSGGKIYTAEWNRYEENKRLPNGIYFLRIDGYETLMKKIILIK